jgi:hypothetical protein
MTAYSSQQDVQWENELRKSPGSPSEWNEHEQANTSRVPKTHPTKARLSLDGNVSGLHTSSKCGQNQGDYVNE